LRPELLMRAVGALSRAATGDFSVEMMLRELCESAVAALAVDGAGVMRTEDTTTSFVHSHGSVHLATTERLQQVLREGPCQDSMRQGRAVVVADLALDGRWPQFTAAALGARMRAVVAVPLISRGRNWGALDLYRHAAGRWTAEELAAAALLADVAVSYIVMAADRDAARAAQQELVRASMTDQLTGLPNRGLLFDRLEHALAVSRRTGLPLAVVFIDLDRFKVINDTFGHAAGDTVLVEVARRMDATLRQGDTLARLAGDEFVLVCEDLPREDTAQAHRLIEAITERLRAVITRPIRVDGVEVVVSVSMGVVVTGDVPSGQDLLNDADTAMYAAKERGRGRVVIRDHATGAAYGYGRRLERDLAYALDRGQLRVNYQPIVEASTGRVIAVEALLRWKHPEFGLLPAAAFIAMAQATGILPGIGRWVIDQVCAQLGTWRRELDRRAPGTVFCNVTPRELLDPALAVTIGRALAVHGLAPPHLGLEILEEDFTDPRLVSVLARYQDAGHPLSVDDFGTGYSSLSRLVHLSVDYAKIDKSFVVGLPGDTRARALLDAVLVFAATLGLRVICEGVETQDQADHLAAVGCPLLQGFHLAHPLPADALTAVLAASP
jgi:diguanylate cyclase (GGDEF)-like protein